MTILLDTGNLANPLGNIQVSGSNKDTTSSERTVYPSQKPQFIVVSAGKMVVLTAYGIVPDTDILIDKVLLSNGQPELGTGGCCPIITSAESTVLNSVNIPCYTMDMCNPITIIDIPGTYRVSSDSLTDTIRVTAMEYPLQGSGPSTDCCGGA